jgi:hypothetical protein
MAGGSHVLLALLLLCGCTTDASHRAARDTSASKEVAAEIARICAHSEPQRQAEVAKVQREAGMSIVCSGE